MLAPATTIKPNHKAIQAYYETLKSYADLNQTHETGVRTAFIRLLEDTAKLQSWTLVTEAGQKVEGRTIRPDATLYKSAVPRGYYEAKDTKDDLDGEIRKKIGKGYPLKNIIFEDTRQAVLYQNKQEAYRADLQDPQQVAHLLNTFYAYTEPVLDSYDQALEHFSERVPQLARGLVQIIEAAHKTNKRFIAAFEAFFELCQASLNPNISRAAVDEMLVQHLLTERLIRKIFDNPEFTRRNVIAVEIEKVIDALVSQSFDRDEFLRALDSFYQAIESAAHNLEFSEKQKLLNEVYERFFQGYSIKIADTHGIVYTPQPIVDFMCASVVEVLQTEFGKTLGDEDVVILDPATGTGNFVVNMLRRASKADLPALYRDRLFANEIMLLPYYIAALNVEHAYYELTGHYEPFEGLCFVDTLDIAQRRQLSFLTEANSARVERQKAAPITVIIGNPPYNTHQQDENDNNKNRKYEVIDGRIRNTYVKDSKASNRNALSDAYVKFFRWASDRLGGRSGIVCMVTNNGFLRGVAFDGFRKHLLQDYDQIYHFDFRGNARTSGELRRREGGNIFSDQIRVGIGITVLVRTGKVAQPAINYHVVPEYFRAEEKAKYLAAFNNVSDVVWESLKPDKKHTWLVPENADDFDTFLPIGSKDSKAGKAGAESIFKLYSGGVKTNRDDVVYDFDRDHLAERMKQFIEDYNAEVDRYKRAGLPTDIDGFVKYDRIKWSETLKANLQRRNYAEFDDHKVRSSLYRPFDKQFLYFDEILNERRYQLPQIFPTPETEGENRVIGVTDLGSEKPFMLLMSNSILDLHLVGAGSGSQCFPFYTYDDLPSPSGEGPGVRAKRENITDWALAQFRDHYGDPSITKWDIFYYVYGILHHPGYREKFADNLKRELPRIPLAPGVEEALTPNPSPEGEGNQSLEEGNRELASKAMIEAARGLRQRQTDAETILWEHLRDRRLGGIKFKRQRAIPNVSYVVDFYSDESRLVVELDGPIHDTQKEADALRQQELESLGYHVIRFHNDEVSNSLENVLTTILNTHRSHLSPPTTASSLPSPSGEGPGVRASSGFFAFSSAGRQLAELHLNYEQVDPYPLKWIESKDTPQSFYVQKMRLNKEKTALKVNDSLTLSGIPAEAFQYRLGNRSALEWVIDQYQITEDKRSGIKSDPNRPDDERYIVDLVARVITVSLETVNIVTALPEQYA